MSNVIDKLCLTTPLGKSDHVCMEFGYLTNHYTQSPLHQKLDYWKADYESVKRELSAIDWDTELLNKSVTESWQIFQKKLLMLCEKYTCAFEEK